MTIEEYLKLSPKDQGYYWFLFNGSDGVDIPNGCPYNDAVKSKEWYGGVLDAHTYIMQSEGFYEQEREIVDFNETMEKLT